MATTSTSYTGNGSTTAFSISFPYLRTTDILVTVATVTQILGTDYTISGSTLTFTVAPINGSAIKFQRVTSRTPAITTYADGSSWSATDSNKLALQLIYCLQEIDEGAVVANGLTLDDGTVPLAKLVNVAQNTFAARKTAGTGAFEAITASEARTALGLAATATSTCLVASNNLSDIGSASTARTNLGLDSLLAAKQSNTFAAFKATNSAGTSIPVAETELVYATEVEDSNTAYSSPRFTADANGLYYFCASARMSTSPTATMQLKLKVNGTTIFALNPQYLPGNSYCQVAGFVRLTAGQYVSVFTQQDSGGALALQPDANSNQFFGFFVRP